MRVEDHQGLRVGGTSEEILGEIREFCRATQTAESTFGRLVVNDGKLVSRLRDKVDQGKLASPIDPEVHRFYKEAERARRAGKNA